MKVDVDDVLKAAVPGCRNEADLDAALSEECARRFGGNADSVQDAINRFLAEHMKRTGGSRLDAARQMSGGDATFEQRSYSSVEDMPPELQARVREMMKSGKRSFTTSRVVSWDSASGEPPPPEAIAAARERVRREQGPLDATFGVPSGRAGVKWAVLLVAVLALLAVALLLVWLRM